MTEESAPPPQPGASEDTSPAARYLDRWETHLTLVATGRRPDPAPPPVVTPPGA